MGKLAQKDMTWKEIRNRKEIIMYSLNTVNSIYSMFENDMHMKKVSLESKVECLKQVDCYEKDGKYYRIDHFDNVYVIEVASGKSDAEHNVFEDADLYSDELETSEILNEIKKDFRKGFYD